MPGSGKENQPLFGSFGSIPKFEVSADAIEVPKQEELEFDPPVLVHNNSMPLQP